MPALFYYLGLKFHLAELAIEENKEIIIVRWKEHFKEKKQ